MSKITQWIGRQISSILISRFQDANLLIHTPDGSTHFLGQSNNGVIDPIKIRDWSFFWDSQRNSKIGKGPKVVKKGST